MEQTEPVKITYAIPKHLITYNSEDTHYVLQPDINLPQRYWGKKVSSRVLSYTQRPEDLKLSGDIVFEDKGAHEIIRIKFPEGSNYHLPSSKTLPYNDPNTIHLVVLGDPTAQKRHRSRIQEHNGNNIIRNYDPSEGKKGDFLSVVQANAPEKPYETALKVDCYFFFSRPKSHYGTGKKAGVLKPNAPFYKISKPDRDNCDKFVLDALNGIFWKDDSIVADGRILRAYDEKPRTEVVITVL